MKMIQILTVGILTFTLNAHADLESDVGEIRQILSNAERQRQTAEFQAHINAGFQQAANYHAQQKAEQAAILAGPSRVVVVVQPAPQVSQRELAEIQAMRAEAREIDAILAAIKDPDVKVSNDLLFQAAHHKNPAVRKKARQEIFKAIEQPNVTAQRELTEDERGHAST